MTVSKAVDYNLDTGIADLQVRGHLDLDAVAEVRTALGKCFAQAPEVVLVDLAGVTADAPAYLFAAALHAHRSGQYPALLLHSASPDLAALLRPSLRHGIRLFADRAQALAAAGDRPPSGKVMLHLDPAFRAVAGARALVHLVCEDWRIPHLHEPATVIVSELVANSVRHAGTPLTVTVALRSPYLRLHVDDDDPRPACPRQLDPQDWGSGAAPGAGLRLVDLYAAGWGNTLYATGKTVWATLRAVPVDWPAPGR